jgi:hypothetical protein
LENKSRRGRAVDHLGELLEVWLYRNDRQIQEVHYLQKSAPEAHYRVRLRAIEIGE